LRYDDVILLNTKLVLSRLSPNTPIISTNNIAIGMVAGRKYAFNLSKVHFHLNIKLPINSIGKLEKTVEQSSV
jgi:hypothetical protein